MKRLITALLIVSGLCSPFLLSAQDSWQSLINRLTYYSPEKYKSAIDNLKKKYPDSYHPDKDWEKALSELKTDKETLISGLKAKDPKAEKQAKKLLKQLDAALLANPSCTNRKTEKSSPIRNHTSTGKNLCFLPLVPPTAGICSNST